mmetsp:Transcript_84401/g.176661  ORF Transcript_84401/g.176661 Transcript_84401/m.176661 type:complete len:1037 (+) Transcript_84401:1-3111(+)
MNAVDSSLYLARESASSGLSQQHSLTSQDIRHRILQPSEPGRRASPGKGKMWQRVRRAAVAAIALAVLPTSEALYEDEVGQYEWAYQQIGRPTAVGFAEGADKLFVASEAGVLASVALKDGSLSWRRWADQAGGMKLLKVAGRTLVTVSDKNLVQSWKSSSGDLIWQKQYDNTSPVLDLILSTRASKQSMILVRQGEVESRSLLGTSEWSWTLPEGSGRLWASVVSGNSICVVAAEADGSHVQGLKISLSTQQIESSSDLPQAIGTGLRRGAFIVVDGFVVSQVKEKLTAAPICGGTESSLELPSTSFKLLPWQRTAGVFAVSDGSSTLVLGLDEAQGLRKLRSFDGEAVVGPISSLHEDEGTQPVAVALTKEEGTQVQLMDPDSGNVQPAMMMKGYSVKDHGKVCLVLMHEMASNHHRIAITGADYSLVLFENSAVRWLREEALSAILQAAFYSRSAAATLADRRNRPAEEASQGLGALVTQLTHIVQEPAKIVSAFAEWVTPTRRTSSRDHHLLPGAVVPSSAEELRDFGADKLVIAVSAARKMFAMEATTSEVVWMKYLGDGGCVAGSDDCNPILRLLPSAASPVSELLVLLPMAGTGPKAIWFDPLTGAVQKEQQLPAGTSMRHGGALLPLTSTRSIELPSDCEVQPFVLVDDSLKVHMLPDSPSTERIASEHNEKLFFYEVDKKSHSVQGYAIRGKEMAQLWNVELGGDGKESIVADATPEHREWAHVPVYIKGDSTILYKYINTNMLVVATEEFFGLENNTALNLYVLDTITGQVLHQSRVPGGAQPVHLVACDNWVVMHYQNPKRTRFELLVVEFYQAKADDGPWDIIFGGAKTHNHSISAHYLESPVPLQQTYIFQAGVTAITTTATGKGVTPRSIIMGLTTEHLMRVSKDVLNPRRPYPAPAAATATPAGGKVKTPVPSQFAPTKEENLPPYAAVLPLRAQDALTHSHPMPKVRGIISSPSGLESTSMVFSYGLDLFFVPVQSAKAYDVLSPGFNYVLLYLSVAVVVALWASTSYLASRKALQDRWK